MPTVLPSTKHIPLQEFKSIDDQTGTFEGYLSVFGNIDSYKDIVEPGAFQKTIKDARTRNTKYLFPLLWQHDPKEPIGGFLSMDEDGHGLRVVGQIDTTTIRGQQAYSGLKMGYLDGLSIGYDTIKHKFTGDVRHLLEVRMWEGSVVTFPANGDTRVTTVKSACGSTDFELLPRSEPWNPEKSKSQIEEWAKKEDGTLDPEKLKSVHLYVDEGDNTEISSYKLPFCYIRSGVPYAVYKGITACSRALENGDFGDSLTDIKKRIKNYTNKDFPIMSNKHALPSGGRDFSSVLNDRQPDEMTEELYDLFGAMITSLLEVFYHTPDENDIHKTVASSLDQFNEAILSWVDEAVESGLNTNYHHSDDTSDDTLDEEKSMTFAHFSFSSRALKHAVRAYVKECRTLSDDSRIRISAALDGISSAIGDLQHLLDSSDIEDDDDEFDQDDQDQDEDYLPNHTEDEDDDEEDNEPPVKPTSRQKSDDNSEKMLLQLMSEIRKYSVKGA